MTADRAATVAAHANNANDARIANDANDASTRFLYGTRFGRALLHAALALRVPAILGAFLRTPLSALYIKPFVRKKGIDMTGFEGMHFRSFNDFFTRKKAITVDAAPTHFIAPADSLLSVYPVTGDARFHIKGFDYSLQDFFEPARFGIQGAAAASLTKQFEGGTCLVFRLCATDYHRYCYVDSGRHEGEEGKNHFIPGSLYSVQPLAAEHFALYTKNRRSWTLLETAHFGKVAQIEIGAFSVGGIVNHKGSDAQATAHDTVGDTFSKGEEKGYFDLHGSTIALLVQKDVLTLLPEIQAARAQGCEYRVKIGECIGAAAAE